MALGSGCIRYGDDITIAIQGILRSIAVPVSYRCDIAVFIIAEGLGIAFRVGFGIAKTISMFDQVLSII